jgi:hypothetical protein
MAKKIKKKYSLHSLRLKMPADNERFGATAAGSVDLKGSS